MISIMASLFLVALDQTIISTALGRIVEDFNAFSSLTWVVTAYLITTTITTPIAGKFSDLFGRRRMILIGVTIFALGSLLSGMSGSINELIAWRALQGIGGGIITANAFTIVGDLFAARERGKWQGLIGAVFGIASIIGPLLGGFLTESHTILGVTTDWRWTFYINVPIAIIAFGIIATYCPPLKHAKKPKVDYAGASLLAIALATLVVAVDNTDKIFAGFLESTGMSLMTLRIIMVAVVVGAITAFIAVEKRSEEPILRLDFFKNRNFLILTGIAMFVGAAMLGSILYLTQFNQQVFGASPTESGLMLLPMIGGLVAASIGTGVLVSRTGRYKRYMIIGLAVASISIFSLVTLVPSSSFVHEAIIMIFVGAGIGAAMPLLNIAIQNEFEQKDLGVATSSNQLFRGLGSTIGTAIFGGMLTLGITSSIGDMSDNAYIQTLRDSPAASKIITGDINDPNTLLTLNMPSAKTQISEGFNASVANLDIPAKSKEDAKADFANKQGEYEVKIANAFADSLHKIFIVAASTMLAGLVLATALHERALKTADPEDTPGE